MTETRQDRWWVRHGWFVQCLGDTPRLRIVEYFLEYRNDLSVGDVARAVRVHRASVYSIVADLAREGVLVPSRKVSGAQCYVLNMKKEEVCTLLAMFTACMQSIGELVLSEKKGKMLQGRVMGKK